MWQFFQGPQLAPQVSDCKMPWVKTEACKVLKRWVCGWSSQTTNVGIWGYCNIVVATDNPRLQQLIGNNLNFVRLKRGWIQKISWGVNFWWGFWCEVTVITMAPKAKGGGKKKVPNLNRLPTASSVHNLQFNFDHEICIDLYNLNKLNLIFWVPNICIASWESSVELLQHGLHLKQHYVNLELLLSYYKHSIEKKVQEWNWVPH